MYLALLMHHHSPTMLFRGAESEKDYIQKAVLKDFDSVITAKLVQGFNQ
jgi:hypothetical protein